MEGARPNQASQKSRGTAKRPRRRSARGLTLEVGGTRLKTSPVVLSRIRVRPAGGARRRAMSAPSSSSARAWRCLCQHLGHWSLPIGYTSTLLPCSRWCMME